MNNKVVLVTGSNKGIGYGIVETLLKKKSPLKVILTSRNVELGKRSYTTLIEKYPEMKDTFYYHQLDITNMQSISELISYLKNTFGGLDYLVNNAGVATHGDTFNVDVCNSTFHVNVNGTINFTEEMIKHNVINKSGKIILVGSCSGFLNKLSNQTLRDRFKSATTKEELIQLGEEFKQSIADNKVAENGWPFNTYSVSKMIVNSYARVLSLYKEIQDNDISVYACHPGWVRTDMAGPKAPLTIEEGAKMEVFLIELPDGINKEYQGKYFSDCKLSSFED